MAELEPEAWALLGTVFAAFSTSMGLLIKWMMSTITQYHQDMKETVQNNTAAMTTMATVGNEMAEVTKEMIQAVNDCKRRNSK